MLNKTNFKQIIPRGYCEPANYWDPIPSYVTASPFLPTLSGFGDETSIDDRFQPILNNTGKTFELTSNQLVPNLNFADQTSNTQNQVVSAFITGRRYSSNGNHWQDDELNDDPFTNGEGLLGGINVVSNKADDLMNGLYFVNDPSNEASTIPTNPFLTPPLAPGKGGKHPQLHTKKWGFNELLHRQMDLCSLVNIPCDGTIGTANSSSTLSLLKLINFIPFPLGAH